VIPLGLRNRIAGLIAITFGLALAAILLLDEGWDTRGTVIRYEALAGALMFIGLGVWYLWRGASAEPWAGKGGSADATTRMAQRQPPDTEARMAALSQALEKDPAFLQICQELETEYRNKLPDPHARLANLKTEEEIDAACQQMEAETDDFFRQQA